MTTTADNEAAAHIEAEVRGQRLPGLAAAVVWPDGSVWQCGFGVADLATGTPVRAGTPYLWFSMTKIMTATAVLRLAGIGAIDLDTPVNELFPPMRLVGQPRPMTVRHLLNHSSGLSNPVPVRWVRPAGEPPLDQRGFVLRLLRRHPRLRFVPGTKASYTNLGYLVLGEVVAEATGQPFTDHVREHVLQPLGMTRTGFSYVDTGGEAPAVGYQPLPAGLTPLLRAALPSGIVAGRQAGRVAYHPFHVLGAAYGGLVGPVADAASLLRLHRANGTPLLPADLAAQMRRVVPRGGPRDFGLGWYRPAGRTGFVEHLGGGSGFWNVMRLYPDCGLGVVLMGNVTHYDHEAILAGIARIAGT